MNPSAALTALAVLFSCGLQSVAGLDNGLALTPPLGYVRSTQTEMDNTWNRWGANIDEALIKQTADLMVSSGLKDAGYRYLVIDDAWSNRLRDGQGRIEANSQKFPSGMKNISDYVHSKGLLFGMYSDAGAFTCLGYPGSRGNEKVDADTFAGFGIDFLKYDNCWAPPSDWVVARYEAMRDALNETGRPILFSMCDWGVGDPWKWAQKVGNSWRTTEDIGANWPSVLVNLDDTVGLSKYAGPGGWNDPDILEVGNGALTLNEQRSHFALWALLKSPLMVGTDLAKLSPEAYGILLAAEVLAVNQDPLGVAGDLVWKEGPSEVYAGPLKGGSRAVVLFNRHVIGTQYPFSNITVSWRTLGYESDAEATVRDLFAEKDLGTFRGSLTLPVDIHDARMVKIEPLKQADTDEDWRPWHVNQAVVAKVRSKVLQRRASTPLLPQAIQAS